MDKMDFQLTGKKELTHNLIGIGKAVGGTSLEKAVLAGGEVIAEDARRRAPRSAKPGPRGHAADTIAARVVDSGPTFAAASIGPSRFGGWWLMFHEWGASKMAARPHLRPAMDERGKDAVRVMRKVWREQIIGAIPRSRSG